MVLVTSLLNTEHYKVWVEGKVEQSRKWGHAFLLHLGVVAIEEGAFESPSTKIADFTYIYIYIYSLRVRLLSSNSRGIEISC